MFKFAKPKEELLNAPVNIYNAMTWFVEYFTAGNELRSDISDRFDYPTLWAAIDRLIYFKEKETTFYIEMKTAGYTTNDAFALEQYEKED
jgi:hypothetical protein